MPTAARCAVLYCLGTVPQAHVGKDISEIPATAYAKIRLERMNVRQVGALWGPYGGLMGARAQGAQPASQPGGRMHDLVAGAYAPCVLGHRGAGGAGGTIVVVWGVGLC